MDGIYLRRNWGGEYENVAILVAIAVNEDGFREVLGVAEEIKEDKESWRCFFQWLCDRGLDGVKLIVGDKCMEMLEAVGEVFPNAKYQRCIVHFYHQDIQFSKKIFSCKKKISFVDKAAILLTKFIIREGKCYMEWSPVIGLSDNRGFFL